MKLRLKKSLIVSLVMAMAVGACVSGAAPNKSYQRIYGRNRVKTSINVSRMQDSDILVMSHPYSFADSLSAMNLVNKFNARFMVFDGSDDEQINEIINDPTIKKIYFVGGYFEDNTFVPFQIWRELWESKEVELVSGDNIYDTNKKTLEIVGYRDVGVATGRVYADALSAYSLIREQGIGLMLVDGSIPYDVGNYNVKYTFGGTESVAQEGGERIAGRSRYETSIKIADKTSYSNIAFVDGRNYADAVSAVNLTNSRSTDIVLTPNNNPIIEKETKRLTNKANQIYVVGGHSSVSDESVQKAMGTYVAKPKPAPKPSQAKPKDTNTYIKHPTGLIQVRIPQSYMDDIMPELVKEDIYHYISFNSKYHYKYNYENDWMEGTGIFGIDVVPMSYGGAPYGEKQIGYVIKNGVKRKVIAFWATDYPSTDESEYSKRRMQNARNKMVNVINSNITGIRGWKYKKISNVY